MLTMAIWVESFRCAGILLLQWQGENLAHRQYLKFSHFQPVHCASKNPISRKVFRRFSKSSPHLEDVDGGHLVEKFQVRTYFTSAMARWTFVHRQHLKFCYFQPVHCASRNPISPKIFNQFSKSSRQLEDVEGGHLGGKFQVRRYFTFAMARWKLGASTTFEILPRSTCTLCQQKSYISKGIQSIFEIFASARRWWRWSFGWKVSGAQVFYFCNGKVKTWRSDNIWNFATFKLYTVPAKILYLQRYSTDFRNLCVSSKMLTMGIWVKSFMCARILLLQWQGENFAHRQHLKFCHFQPVHCASKNPISPKVFNRFSKSLPQLEDVDGAHLGEKFQVRTYFAFAMARWKLGASTIIEILPLSTCTLCQQKSYISKGIQSIFEIFASAAIWVGSFRCAGVLLLQWQSENFAHRQTLNFATYNLYTVQAEILYLQRYSTNFRNLRLSSKMLTVGHLGGKFQVRRYFTFAMARWKLGASTTFEILPRSTCTLCQQKSYISKGIQSISKSLPQLEDVDDAHLGGKFQVRRYFTFAMARWKLCASTTIEILPLSNCTLCQQKSYISKGIHAIVEIFASSRRCWRWPFGWKVSGAQVFYFCNGKVKTFVHRHTFDILLLSTCTLCQQKSYISKGIQSIFEIFASARRCWRWPFGWKVSCAQVFYFCNGKVKTWRIDNIIEIFSRSSCTLCQQKSYISKGIQSIFEIFAPARRCWQWKFGWKVSGAQGVLLLQWQSENFAHRQNFKFCHFQPATVQAEILYLQRYSTNFRNLRLSSKMLRLGIWVESFRCAGILILQWQGENLAHRQHLKFCHVQPVHCASKNPISPKVFNRIFEIFASARRCWRWPFGWKVSCAQVFCFCNKVKTWRIDNNWNFATFNLYTVRAKILYLQRCSTDFRNLCPSSKMLTVAIWVECFRCAGVLLLQWQSENFPHRQHFKFCYFQPVHCASRNPISPKIFNQFSKSFPQLEDAEGGHLGGKFQLRRHFTFAMARWKVSASTTFEILLLSTCTLCQQ